MTNGDIAAALAHMGELMELLGFDPFKCAAHARASRAVDACADDLVAVAKTPEAKKRLTAIDGIGPKTAEKIIELATTGACAEMNELAAQVPAGLLPLLKLQGLGPKTVRVFWQDAGVTDLAGLKKIIDDGSILKLPRMGEKAVEKLKAAIAVAAEAGVRLALGPATMVAERVIARLESIEGVKKIAYAGSLRRGRDTIGDIDILIATTKPALAAEAFRTMPDVKQVLVGGETKSSVRIAVGVANRWDQGEEGGTEAELKGPSVQVDLKVVADDQWGAALCYFTGSKDHNVALRQRALDMGFTLNEYGLFKHDPKHDTPPHQRGEKPVVSKTEADIYKKLGVPFVPPELRENRGEFSLKETPRLIELDDIKAELHAHTTASDGVLSILQLAQEAKRRGFHTIAVTDHSQSSAVAGGLKPAALRKHIEAVRAAQEEIKGITILAGSEVDILLHGDLDYKDDLLAELDIVVASPHAALTQGSADATERLIKAVSHPLVHILGHPTGRLVLRRRGLEPDMHAVIAAARAHDVALEINSHWMRLDLRDTHVKAAVDAGCHLAINCDVHHPEDYDNLRFGVTTARRGWVLPDLCVNTWPAKKLHAWLKKKR